MSFDKLKADELRVLASEGFAVEVPEGATKPQIVALLAENGATWDVALQSPYVPERFRPAVEESAPVVTSSSVQAAEETSLTRTPERDRGAVVTTAVTRGEAPAVEVVPAVVVTPPVVTPTTTMPDKVLLKMNRENPRFDIQGYKFTKDHPFALVDAAAAESIVENVEGFAYATPKEAKAFYE